MLKKILLSIGLVTSVYFFGQTNTGNPKFHFGSNSTYDHGMMPTNLDVSGTY